MILAFVYQMKRLKKLLKDNSDENCRQFNHWNFTRDLNEHYEIRRYSYEEVSFGNKSDFSYANMQCATLTKANLKGAYLKSIHLEGSTLSEVHLENATLWDVHLEGITFSNVQQAGTNFKEVVHLGGASLWFTHLEDAKLPGVRMKGADLKGADFKNADLSNAVFYNDENICYINREGKNATVENRYEHDDINLQGTKLYNVDLRHIKGLTANQIAGADLTCATLPKNLDNLTEITKPINESIKSNGTLFTAITIALFIVFLLVLKTPADFEIAQIPINGINMEMSRNYLWMVPVGLWIVFLSFCINLSNFWNILGSMPAVFSDGRSLPMSIDQWGATFWLYLMYHRLNYHEFINGKETSIYIQAVFSYIILYLPIPALTVFVCMKFGMYYNLDNLTEIIFSWFATIAILITLGYYSNLMKKSIDK